MFKDYPNVTIGKTKVTAYPLLGLTQTVFFGDKNKRVIISIHEAPAEDYGIAFRPCRDVLDVLEVSFSDIDDSYFPEYKKMFEDGLLVLFAEDQAAQIVSFVKKYIGVVDEISVHCHLGASRSPAVCAAISKYYTGKDNYWFNEEIAIPNIYIYNMLLQAFKNSEEKENSNEKVVNNI